MVPTVCPFLLGPGSAFALQMLGGRLCHSVGCGGRHLQQQGLLHAFPEGLEFKLSLKRCWGWGELGNLLGPQAGECNTLLQKYSVILALSLENSDVTSSQSASGRSCLLLLLQLAVQKRERGRGRKRRRDTGRHTDNIQTDTESDETETSKRGRFTWKKAGKLLPLAQLNRNPRTPPPTHTHTLIGDLKTETGE